MAAPQGPQLETPHPGLNVQGAALRAIAAQRQARQGLRHARTIALTSATRGVGKTTLALNLGIALQKMGLRVLILDAEPGPSGAVAALHAEPRYALDHVLRGERPAREAAIDGPCGLRIVAAGAGLDELGNLTPWQHERLWHGLAEFDEEYDFVLIETTAGPAPSVVGILASTDEAIVVTVPEPEAITEAYALIKALAHENSRVTVHLVVNRARLSRQAYDVASRIAEVTRRFLGVDVHPLGFVPDDPQVGLAALAGAPFVEAHPQCQAARRLTAVATRLRGQAGRHAGTALTECLRRFSTLVAQGHEQGTAGAA
jgi:flagellar biosynthesis protein FlhG